MDGWMDGWKLVSFTLITLLMSQVGRNAVPAFDLIFGLARRFRCVMGFSSDWGLASASYASLALRWEYQPRFSPSFS
jgi:hypothetical protein